VIGIVADTKQYGLTSDTTKQFYEPFAQAPLPAVTLVVRTDATPGSIAGGIRSVAHELDRDLPVGQIRTIDEILGQVVAPQRFSVLLLVAFAMSAIFLAAIGLYSVVAYSVSQRTTEVGIRVAYGARRHDIVWLVLREGLSLTLAGILVGLAASLAAGRLMESLLFGVPATDPLTFFTVPLVLLGIAALACMVPAYRATRVEPLVTLRTA
jgi:ABC-type antimicrobial peptide transport system permease subunit